MTLTTDDFVHSCPQKRRDGLHVNCMLYVVVQWMRGPLRSRPILVSLRPAVIPARLFSMVWSQETEKLSWIQEEENLL